MATAVGCVELVHVMAVGGIQRRTLLIHLSNCVLYFTLGKGRGWRPHSESSPSPVYICRSCYVGECCRKRSCIGSRESYYSHGHCPGGLQWDLTISVSLSPY